MCLGFELIVRYLVFYLVLSVDKEIFSIFFFVFYRWILEKLNNWFNIVK